MKTLPYEYFQWDSPRREGFMVNRARDCFAIKLNPRCVYLLVHRQKEQERLLTRTSAILGRLRRGH